MTITVHEGGISVTGPESMALYRLIVLRLALVLYAQTGLRATRHLSPTAMLKMAGEETGKTYKRGQYLLAANDLTQLIEVGK